MIMGDAYWYLLRVGIGVAIPLQLPRALEPERGHGPDVSAASWH